MMEVTKRYSFSASHRLHSAALSDEDNERTFGKCNNPFGHGHNYVLEVSVRGPADPQTGMVVERRALDAFVEEAVLRKLDHTYLNQDIEELRDSVPTTENLACVVERWLRSEWPGGWSSDIELARIRVEETPRNSFELGTPPGRPDSGKPVTNETR